jgi:hypothetical protein
LPFYQHASDGFAPHRFYGYRHHAHHAHGKHVHALIPPPQPSSPIDVF